MATNFITGEYEEPEEREIDPIESSVPVDIFFRRKSMGFSVREEQEIPSINIENILDKLS